MKLQLIGLRPASDYEVSHTNSRKVLAILRSASGRRVVAEIESEDTKDFATCRSAIFAYLTEDGVQRYTEDDIAEPDDNASDLPWHQNKVSSKPFGQSGSVVSGGAESPSLVPWGSGERPMRTTSASLDKRPLTPTQTIPPQGSRQTMSASPS